MLPGTSFAFGAGMTQPRRVVPGMIQLVTRRVTRRAHLLRPDPRLVQLCQYLLGVYCERYGILLHAVVFMSNHMHLIVTDSWGCIPDFLRDFHRTLALGVKVLRHWDGNLWDSQPTSRVQLCTPQAVIEKLAYIMANPVNAGLVHRAEDWPGFTTLPHQLGAKSWTALRPDFFFDPENPLWPKTTTLRLTPPRTPWDIEEVRHRVAQELEHVQSQAHRKLCAKGCRVFGRAAVLKSSPYEQSKTPELRGDRNPSIAVGRGQQEAFLQACSSLRTFRLAYQQALQQWRDGYRNVLFPAATWLMRWLHRAQLAPS